MKLSEHFTLEEMTFSQTAARRGIANDPPPTVVENLRWLASRLEVIRTKLGGVPIHVSSGYRSLALNRVTPGSSKTSAHTKGLAADIGVDGMSPKSLALKVADMDLDIDQLILEFDSWVHVGLSDAKPRGQLLTIRHGTGYMEGIA